MRKNGRVVVYTNVKTMQLVEIDCIERKLKYNTIIWYDSKGNVILSKDEESDWRNVVPETIGEQLFKKVCKLFN